MVKPIIPSLLIHQVTTKAYDVLPAVTALSSRLAPGAVVVVMCNGMGVMEKLINGPQVR